MERLLFIYLQDREAEKINWILFDESTKPIKEKKLCALQDCPSITPQTKIIVLFPSEEILFTKVMLPPIKKSQRPTAALYALEEKLAEDVDLLHTIVIPQEEPSWFSAGMIQKTLVENWLKKLSKENLIPHFLLPDFMMLPVKETKENEWVVLLENNRAIVRTEVSFGFAASGENYQIFLTLFPPSGISILHENPLQRFIQKITEQPKLFEPYNLLQGTYRQKPRWHETQKIWRWPIVLGLSGIILFILLSAIKYAVLSSKNHELEKSLLSLYQNAYPHATELNSPQARIAQEISQLKSEEKNEEALFLIAQTGNILQKFPDATIQNFNFRDGTLLVTLQTSTFQRLEEITKRLTETGLTIKQNEAARKNNNITAILSVTQRGEKE